MINVNGLLESLPTSGLGMLGVFVVMGAIYVSIKLLCWLIRPKKEQ